MGHDPARTRAGTQDARICTRARRGAYLTAIAAIGLGGTDAHAGNIWGGEILAGTHIHTEFGLAHAEVGVRMATSQTVELMPRLRVGYARGLTLDWTVDLAMDVRVQLVDAAGFHVALTLSAPVSIDPEDQGLGFAFGLGHPGIMLDYTFPTEMSFGFGVRFEDDLLYRNRRLTFSGYLPFVFSLEGDVSPVIRMGGKLEGGPTFGDHSFAGDVAFELRALLGIEVAL